MKHLGIDAGVLRLICLARKLINIVFREHEDEQQRKKKRAPNTVGRQELSRALQFSGVGSFAVDVQGLVEKAWTLGVLGQY
jgi:hypothetical protein